MALFTVESGRLAGLKSVEVKRQRKLNPPQNDPIVVESSVEPDFLAADLACACDETLKELRKAKQPQHKAQLARALRDLRETWHLATGKPRPGLTRPDQAVPRRREVPRSLNGQDMVKP
jgi:hypothetical protein